MSGSLVDEFTGCDFGDDRLSKRVVKLAKGIENCPTRSFPSVLKSKADWEACYRFFDNESVTPEAIVGPHIQQTQNRIRECDVVIFAQDTTELDLTRPKKQVNGAGPIDCNTRRGGFFHPMMAFDTEGLPLGLIHFDYWTRAALSDVPRNERTEMCHKTPIEQKESYRWLKALQAASETAKACPDVCCVCVADSESDIYELYELAHQLRTTQPNLHLLSRGKGERATSQDELWMGVARKAPIVGTKTLKIRERDPKINVKKKGRNQTRTTRTAEVRIHATHVEIRRPCHRTRNLAKKLPFNLVLLEEINPPVGEPPIQWLLVTTLPIASPAEVHSIIDYYCRRWQIEVYFRTLKSGCRIEKRRFEELDRIWNCLALLAVVAWRVMYVTHLGRGCPDIDCEAVFTTSEWKSLYAILGKPIPEKGCPPLQEVVRAIGQLGGYIKRNKNEPGTQSVWIGLQRVYDLSNAWDTFGPGAKKISPD